ncbi:aminotransferase class V-fold PLP-dependent enzyme [Miniphocaeibacter halophilus]|uniref:Aminotransferase class V-fold PLP-dependent enzyme n=1 Tax=Miniphocaeibacter halophilus TaxID=2931922 RepID=A0AC61NDV0_9FIRM|nr:aminotransferase class V-fold PLP-dependent enzyme [Miniphocaeibacter halophilus]QQK08768.1 aminotransferase class V-fold PLP-dependent enzyme [Miniphocaeibacter halophilus]
MIYFDNAATTFPKPEIVYEKTLDAMKNFGANPGRSGHRLSLKMDREIFDVRQKLTDFIGGDNPLNLIFTKNCTESLNIAIKGIVEEKSHVITTAMEHNSVLRPLKQLENIGYIDLTIIPANELGLIDIDDIKNAIRENTKLCVITIMSNLVGTITEIDKISEILKENNIKLIVDAAQGIGYLNIDVIKSNIDILCFPGHKSLFGPMGTGALYINGDLELKTIMEGGTGSFSLDLNQPKVYPDRLEAGTLNGTSIVGLGAGIDFINEVGLEVIRNHENQLKNKFIDGLKNIKEITVYGPKDSRQGHVVPINIKGLDSSELAFKLDDEYGICVRAGYHCAPLAHRSIGTEKLGAARFSFSYFNTLEEVQKALEILEKIAKEVTNGNI